jgi:hypothetical protein
MPAGADSASKRLTLASLRLDGMTRQTRQDILLPPLTYSGHDHCPDPRTHLAGLLTRLDENSFLLHIWM